MYGIGGFELYAIFICLIPVISAILGYKLAKTKTGKPGSGHWFVSFYPLQSLLF